MNAEQISKAAERPASLPAQGRKVVLLAILVVSLLSLPFGAVSQEREYFPITPNPRVPPTVNPNPSRPFDVRPSDVRRPPSSLNPDKPKTVDKNKIKSLFDKAKDQPESKKKSSGGVSTQSATGTSKEPKAKPRPDRLPEPEPPKPAANRERDPEKKVLPLESPAESLPLNPETVTSPPNKVNDLPPPSTAVLPTIKAEDMRIGPQIDPRPLDLGVFQQVPERPSVELPKGGAELPGTGLPGKDGIGGLKGGFQGGLQRPDLNHDTGEERYQGESPFASNPAIDPSGSLGEAGGWLGTAGQAYGGKGGKTMEQVGGLMQSESLGQAAGKGADILLPGSGSFVEAAANGDTAGMVNAGATAAGNLASDLAIGLILGFVGGGILGMAIGYALSATGAGRAIADGVTAGVKWIAEKVGLGGGEKPPEPEPAPAPEPAIYDENHSKGGGKKGPSVINENQIKPLQDKLNEDLLGENRDAEEFVDTSDTPPPAKVAVGAGCDPEELANKGGGTINFKDPFTIKDMEKPGYDKY